MKYAHVKPKNLLAMNPRANQVVALDAIITFEDEDDYIITFDMKSHKFKTQSKELNEILYVEYRLKYVNSYFLCTYYPAGFYVEGDLQILRR